MVVNIQKKKLLRGWAKVPYGCFLERNRMVEGIPDLEKHWITFGIGMWKNEQVMDNYGWPGMDKIK